MLGLTGLGLAGLLGVGEPARAQVVGAGGSGGLGTRVNGVVGGGCEVGLCGVSGGTGAGPNLFHRFTRFDTRGGVAGVRFENGGYRNVVVGVTSPAGTFIDKAISLSSPGSLFWLSPGGIAISGAGGFQNVQQLTLSTATGLRFADGSLFDAARTTAAQAALLGGRPLVGPAGLVTQASALEALGLEANGDLSLDGGTLTVEAGLLLDAQGGNVLLQAAGLQAPGGSIDVVGAEISLKGSELSVSAGDGGGAGGTIALWGGAGDVLIQESELLANGSLGGDVQVLGNRIALEGSRLEASGLTGGGRVQVGGGYQGADLGAMNSTFTWVGAGSVLAANALEQGDGGLVVTWSDIDTLFYGAVEARGGLNGGDGGVMEVSGKERLGFAGTADASAPQGQVGSLLLDPGDLFVTSIDPSGVTPPPTDQTSTLLADAFPGFGAVSVNASGTDYRVRGDSVATALINNDVLLEAQNNIYIQESILIDSVDPSGTTLFNLNIRALSGNIEISPNADIDIRGNIFLEAGANILASQTSIISQGGVVVHDARSNIVANTTDIISQQLSGIYLNAGGSVDINNNSALETPGGIYISSLGDIDVNQSFLSAGSYIDLFTNGNVTIASSLLDAADLVYVAGNTSFSSGTIEITDSTVQGASLNFYAQNFKAVDTTLSDELPTELIAADDIQIIASNNIDLDTASLSVDSGSLTSEVPSSSIYIYAGNLIDIFDTNISVLINIGTSESNGNINLYASDISLRGASSIQTGSAVGPGLSQLSLNGNTITIGSTSSLYGDIVDIGRYSSSVLISNDGFITAYDKLLIGNNLANVSIGRNLSGLTLEAGNTLSVYADILSLDDVVLRLTNPDIVLERGINFNVQSATVLANTIFACGAPCNINIWGTAFDGTYEVVGGPSLIGTTYIVNDNVPTPYPNVDERPGPAETIGGSAASDFIASDSSGSIVSVTTSPTLSEPSIEPFVEPTAETSGSFSESSLALFFGSSGSFVAVADSELSVLFVGQSIPEKTETSTFSDSSIGDLGAFTEASFAEPDGSLSLSLDSSELGFTQELGAIEESSADVAPTADQTEPVAAEQAETDGQAEASEASEPSAETKPASDGQASTTASESVVTNQATTTSAAETTQVLQSSEARRSEELKEALPGVQSPPGAPSTGSPAELKGFMNAAAQAMQAAGGTQ